MLVLVIDVGSSSLRVSALDELLNVKASAQEPYPTYRYGATTVTFDPSKLADLAIGLSTKVHSQIEPSQVAGLAITNQRASAVLFSMQGPRALGPGLSWEDLRTAPQCLGLSQQGFSCAPNESATKYAALLATNNDPKALVGTVDTWLSAVLTGGKCFATDVTNAGVTGLTDRTATHYDTDMCHALGLDPKRLAEIVAPFTQRGMVRLNGCSVPLLVTVGDQQASLVGQGGLIDSRVKITLGTSAVADVNSNTTSPAFVRRGPHGTFPIVIDATDDGPTFGLEAFGMTCGSLLTWLTQVRVLPSPAATDSLAASATRKGTPIVIPALAGLGTPHWDFGARTVISGITADTGIPEVALGALEGIAFLAADLIQALWKDANIAPAPVYLDGRVAMAKLVVSRLSGALGVPIAVSSSSEATTRGAGILTYRGLGICPTIPPPRTIDATRGSESIQDLFTTWKELLPRAKGALPALSAVAF